jgi:hypothetical protein
MTFSEAITIRLSDKTLDDSEWHIKDVCRRRVTGKYDCMNEI